MSENADVAACSSGRGVRAFASSFSRAWRNAGASDVAVSAPLQAEARFRYRTPGRERMRCPDSADTAALHSSKTASVVGSSQGGRNGEDLAKFSPKQGLW
ncbi:hypothetical protein RNS86_13005, partial [Staphylococcus pseudintermedius]|nr:hypothetical protein [Staphylococcus pseudintermedius]